MAEADTIRDEDQRRRLARAIVSDVLLYHLEQVKGVRDVEEARAILAVPLEEARALYAGRTGDDGARIDAEFCALCPGVMAMKAPTASRLGVHDANSNKIGLWVWFVVMAIFVAGILLLRAR